MWTGIDVVLKSLFMRLGEPSDDICNRLDSEMTMKLYTIANKFSRFFRGRCVATGVYLKLFNTLT
jgi:hypothetical protein